MLYVISSIVLRYAMLAGYMEYPVATTEPFTIGPQG